MDNDDAHRFIAEMRAGMRHNAHQAEQLRGRVHETLLRSNPDAGPEARAWLTDEMTSVAFFAEAQHAAADGHTDLADEHLRRAHEYARRQDGGWQRHVDAR